MLTRAASSEAPAKIKSHGAEFVLPRQESSAYEWRAVQRANSPRPRSILVRALAFVLMVTVFLAPGLARDAIASDDLPRHELLDRALAAYRRLDAAGKLRPKILTVIDYSLPSWDRRLWVLDPTKRLRVLFHEFVAHGRGSATEDDPDYAVAFGNEEASLRSSLGAFLTGSTYTGQHGRSLELYGLEPGVNDKAFARRIVMHPAQYVSATFRAEHGRVGRSFGCPALDPAVSTAVIDRIADGSVIFVAGNDAPLPAAAKVEPTASTTSGS